GYMWCGITWLELVTLAIIFKGWRCSFAYNWVNYLDRVFLIIIQKWLYVVWDYLACTGDPCHYL
ncbi:hypothetical protein, partial [Pseudoalteromonas undina]